MGRAPAKISDLEHCVEVCQGMLRGERVTHTWGERDTEIEFLVPEQGWVNV